MTFQEFWETHRDPDKELGWEKSDWVEHEIRKKFGFYAPIKKGIIGTNNLFPNDGWIYVIGFEGHFKVGFSTQIENRVKTYIKAPPFDIILYGIHYFGPIAFQIEQFIHTLFADQRRRGEWFYNDCSDPYEISMALSRISPYKTNLSSYKAFHDMGFTLGTLASIFDTSFDHLPNTEKRYKLKAMNNHSRFSALWLRQDENKK